MDISIQDENTLARKISYTPWDDIEITDKESSTRIRLHEQLINELKLKYTQKLVDVKSRVEILQLAMERFSDKWSSPNANNSVNKPKIIDPIIHKFNNKEYESDKWRKPQFGGDELLDSPVNKNTIPLASKSWTVHSRTHDLSSNNEILFDTYASEGIKRMGNNFGHDRVENNKKLTFPWRKMNSENRHCDINVEKKGSLPLTMRQLLSVDSKHFNSLQNVNYSCPSKDCDKVQSQQINSHKTNPSLRSKNAFNIASTKGLKQSSSSIMYSDESEINKSTESVQDNLNSSDRVNNETIIPLRERWLKSSPKHLHCHESFFQARRNVSSPSKKLISKAKILMEKNKLINPGGAKNSELIQEFLEFLKYGQSVNDSENIRIKYKKRCTRGKVQAHEQALREEKECVMMAPKPTHLTSTTRQKQIISKNKDVQIKENSSYYPSTKSTMEVSSLKDSTSVLSSVEKRQYQMSSRDNKSPLRTIENSAGDSDIENDKQLKNARKQLEIFSNTHESGRKKNDISNKDFNKNSIQNSLSNGDNLPKHKISKLSTKLITHDSAEQKKVLSGKPPISLKNNDTSVPSKNDERSQNTSRCSFTLPSSEEVEPSQNTGMELRRRLLSQALNFKEVINYSEEKIVKNKTSIRSPAPPLAYIIPPPPLLPVLQQVNKGNSEFRFNSGRCLKPLHWRPIRLETISSDEGKVWRELHKTAFPGITENAKKLLHKLFIKPIFHRASFGENNKKKSLIKNHNLDSLSISKKYNLAQSVIRKPSARLLDTKKAQNIGIFIFGKQIRAEIIQTALLEFDEIVFNLDTLKLLASLNPSVEEIRDIREFVKNNPEIMLDKPEQFIHDIYSIPQYTDRLQCLILYIELGESIRTIQSRLDGLLFACQTLCSSEGVRRLLALVLELGNKMNDGTERGHADGFDLQILASLKNIKSVDNSCSLLLFLVREYIDVYCCDISGKAVFPLPEPSDLKSCLLDLSEIEQDISWVIDSVEKGKQATGRILVTASFDQSQQFNQKIQPFFHEGEKSIQVLNDTFADAGTSFNTLLAFFGVPKVISSKDFFSLWFSFSTDFKELWIMEVGQRFRQRKSDSHSASTK